MYLFLWCAAGVAISVLFPILWEVVYRKFPKPRSVAPAGAGATLRPFWQAVKPYVLLGIVSLLTGLLIFAALGDELKDYRAALLAGYTWDSTLQKLRR